MKNPSRDELDDDSGNDLKCTIVAELDLDFEYCEVCYGKCDNCRYCLYHDESEWIFFQWKGVSYSIYYF